MKFKSIILAFVFFIITAVQVQAADTIKVGILHSLSGTMAISETSLRDVALMAIEEINAKGGVLGKKLEPVVVDPASNWPLFAEKARELIQKQKVEKNSNFKDPQATRGAGGAADIRIADRPP